MNLKDLRAYMDRSKNYKKKVTWNFMRWSDSIQVAVPFFVFSIQAQPMLEV